NGPFGKIVAGLIAEGQSEPAVLQKFFERWVSPRRNATIADLQRGKNAGELRSETEPELLNDGIFGAIYYRLLLRSGPLTKRFGEELVEQVLRGHLSEPGRGRSHCLPSIRGTLDAERRQAMSSISTLLTRNLQDVFGEND